MITQFRFVVRLRIHSFIYWSDLLLIQSLDTWLNPKCPPGAFVLRSGSGSHCCFCVSACSAAPFKSVPGVRQHSASWGTCSAEAESLFFTEAEEIYTEKVHSSTRQELPAQTAEYSLLVVIVIIIKTWKQFQKQKFQSAVWTILSTEPGLSADSTSSHPHYILWPLEHFVDCCQRVSGGKRPKQPELGDDGSVEGVSELSPSV